MRFQLPVATQIGRAGGVGRCCNVGAGDTYRSIYATRYGDLNVTPEQALQIAVYQIEQSNVLSRDAANPALTVNNGQVSSHGIELSAAWRATRQFSLSGNLALLKAQFDTLVEAGAVSRVGNVPTNVPERSANLWADYRFADLPLSAGVGLGHVGAMYTNTANTVRINGYTLADAYLAYRLPKALITLRGRNLGDKLYATWSGASAANQVILGAPRSVDLTVKFDF